MNADPKRLQRERLDRQRWRLLHQLERWLNLPFAALGILWLVLLVVELVRGENPLLERAMLTIWAIFIAEFALRFAIAPRKLTYLRRNVLTIVALFIPALRVFRALQAFKVLRALQAARGVRVLRIVTSLNRGMRTLRRGMAKRGASYVFAFTVLVAFVGAAGMFAFEPELTSYPEALWWTAMLMTTIASELWPQTAEGRVLALLISIYSIGVFGYITAALASFFIEQTERPERTGEKADAAAARQDVRTLIDEVRALKEASRGTAAPAANPPQAP
jgi:voltage-gated potassium channel